MSSSTSAAVPTAQRKSVRTGCAAGFVALMTIGSSPTRDLHRARAWRQFPRADLRPFHASVADGIADESLARGEPRSAGFHFDEHDPPQVAFIQAVEHHEVHGTSEELRVLRIELKVRQ